NPTDTDPGIHEGVLSDSDPRLSRLVPLRRLLDQCRALIELLVAHLHGLGHEGHALRALPSRSRQSQQGIRLTDARDPQLGQDPVSGHALRLDSGQARNESVQRRSRIRLPRLRELLSRHARNLSKQLKLGAARINFLADALHRDRKSTRLNSSHDSIPYTVYCLSNN